MLSEMTNVKATICFPDDEKDHMNCFDRLLDFYVKVVGSAGYTTVDVVKEEDRLVIDVNKGFHCITLPINKIQQIITEESK